MRPHGLHHFIQQDDGTQAVGKVGTDTLNGLPATSVHPQEAARWQRLRLLPGAAALDEADEGRRDRPDGARGPQWPAVPVGSEALGSDVGIAYQKAGMLSAMLTERRTADTAKGLAAGTVAWLLIYNKVTEDKAREIATARRAYVLLIAGTVEPDLEDA